MNEYFSAPWSTTLKVSSIVTSALLLGISLLIPLPPKIPFMVWCMVRVFPVGVLLGCALFTVRGYEIGQDCLLVRRLLWQTCIPLHGLTQAEFRPGPFGWAWRTCGNGGLFSYSGWYHQKPLGSFRALGTRTTDAVILSFTGRNPIVLTPENPARFVEVVQATAKPV